MFRCRKIKMRCIPDEQSGPTGPCKVKSLDSSYLEMLMDSVVRLEDTSAFSKSQTEESAVQEKMRP